MSDFDASLPNLFDEDWKSALDATNKAGQGAASYAAPKGSECWFILKKVSLSGGLSVDTQEYPFFGGWSNASLNEKPQALKVEGSIRGKDCLKRRNALVEALRAATSDDAPGHLALSSWGRFSVVVMDWEVSEEMDKKGTFPLSLIFTRSGLSESARQAAVSHSGTTLASALASQSAASQAAFVENLAGRTSSVAIENGFNKLEKILLGVVGRVQAAKTALNTMSSKVQAIAALIDQGIRSPAELAAALYSAVAGVVDSIMGTAEDLDSLISGDSTDDVLSSTDNALNVALAFLSAASYEPDLAVATIKDNATRQAIQNLYRATALYGAAALIPSIASSSYEKFQSLFSLYQTLENSIDLEDPDLFTACTDLRVAVAAELDSLELYHKLSTKLSLPMPVLALGEKLGVGYEDLVALNSSIDDEFLVVGEVGYV